MERLERAVSTPVGRSYELVDLTTRRHLILLLYSVLEDQEPSYGMMHKAAKCLQEMLEKKYAVTLGYGFNDPSIYDIWDYQFQRDIEKYAGLGFLVNNGNRLLARNYYTHRLSLRRPEGTVLLQTTAKWNLQKRFGSIDKLKDDIRSACAIA